MIFSFDHDRCAKYWDARLVVENLEDRMGLGRVSNEHQRVSFWMDRR